MKLRSLLIFISFIAITITTAGQDQTHYDTSRIITSDSAGDKIFEKVEIEASFPGGSMAWRKFLEHNLKGDVAAENGAPSGRYTVWVQFIVDKQGNIADAKALTNLGYGMEQEVLRIIKICPQWQPANQGGRNVKAYRKQPVTFMIEDDGFQITSKEEYLLTAGTDNVVTITAKGVKPKDLSVTISEGTIIPQEESSYIVRVTKTGRVILHLFNKKNKEIGSASFEVKSKNQSSDIPSRPEKLN